MTITLHTASKTVNRWPLNLQHCGKLQTRKEENGNISLELYMGREEPWSPPFVEGYFTSFNLPLISNSRMQNGLPAKHQYYDTVLVICIKYQQKRPQQRCWGPKNLQAQPCHISICLLTRNMWLRHLALCGALLVWHKTSKVGWNCA